VKRKANSYRRGCTRTRRSAPALSRSGAGGLRADNRARSPEQEIVTAGKLGLDKAAAQEAWTAAQWQAVTRRFELEARVRSAFYEVLTAQRELSETEAVVKIAAENVEASRKFEQAGRGSRPDVLRAGVEPEINHNRLIAAKKRLEAAWPLLANTMGTPLATLSPFKVISRPGGRSSPSPRCKRLC
jgi:outer membrane protein, heavy metal efflux system